MGVPSGRGGSSITRAKRGHLIMKNEKGLRNAILEVKNLFFKYRQKTRICLFNEWICFLLLNMMHKFEYLLTNRKNRDKKLTTKIQYWTIK